MIKPKLLHLCWPIFLLISSLSLHSQDNLLISEFMAVNNRVLPDEDGEFEDWIEIFNRGPNTVDLNGWYLTDNAGQLTKWRFPGTNLPPNAHLIVFASNKNRRTPGRPLHTNFRLSDTGEYLGLVRPDGATVVSQFAPQYPSQVPDVSYGLPVTLSTTLLVSNGGPGRFTVPLNGNLGSSWASVGFNDAAWAAVANGVGFEGGGAGFPSSAPLADSVAEFGGNQGSNGWSYGYWSKGDDANGTYEIADFTPFPRGTGTTLSNTNYWNGTKWDWPTASPLTELTRQGGHPAGQNGNPGNQIHWVVRRYLSETNGALRIAGTLASVGTNLSTGPIAGRCGDGVFGRIFVDGAEVFARSVFGESLGYSLVVNAGLGSVIDFAIDPGLAENDQCDTNTIFTATIRAAGDAAVVADTIADWSDTGVQGYRGWTYGFFLKTNSSVTYATNRFTPFPSGTGPHGLANFWTGESWHWFEGDPPFDTIERTISRPNIFPSGGTNALEHWVIRRWVSEITGSISIDWHFSKKDLTGGGATAKVFHNGTQRDSIPATGGDFIGTNKTTAFFNVQAGDLIDFTVEPGTDIVGDICFFNATIYGVTTLSNQFNSDVGMLMSNINATAYLRLPFTVGDASALNTLSLRIKHDDGFQAHLNGTPVAAGNAPAAPEWNSAALTSRNDAEAAQAEEIDLTTARAFLQSGNNVLALQGLNSSAADSDFLLSAVLQATVANINVALPNYFALATPGSLNGTGSTNLGPLITEVTHTPHDPADTEDLYLSARILPTLRPVGTVRLYYRIMFGSESNVVMLDDGLHADGPAGDGVYGAVIPNAISTFGQMIRYYVTAADTSSVLSREPPFPNPTFSSQYFGAVVKNPALTNPLPVLHMFVTPGNLSSADGSQAGRFPCSLYWAGEFYDNVGLNRHGQSSQGFPKKSYDIDFNPDHHFKWHPDEARVDDLNLLSTYPDKAHMRNILSYEIYRQAGSPYHFAFAVRVQTNGGFFGTWHVVENGDADFLQRIGRDPNGALYKMYNTFTSPGNTTIGGDPNAEKKTRKQEGSADLLAMYNGVNGIGTNRITYMWDNVNVAEVANTMAARILTSDVDCCHKNYYFYRDSDGTGEWEAMPWDVDLSHGRNWQSGETYYDDRVYPQNGLFVGGNNSFFQLHFNTAPTRQMYLRRVRTLMDELQQTNGTPAALMFYENLIDGLAEALKPDAAIDLEKWGTWGGGQTGIRNPTNQFYRPLPQSVEELKTNYMPRRRTWVFNQRMTGGELPLAQPQNAMALIGAIDYNPASGNQAQEYIQLINTNNFALDISGWTLSGAIEHTFQGGVVIPAQGSTNMLYVVPDKVAFRKRTASPKGGEGRYVEGNYKGQLSARGETIILSDKSGRIVRTNTYLGNPSLPQQYLRITEVMYHPPIAPPGSPYFSEDFEYLELKNTGPGALSLTGVHFTNGIEFNFSGSAVTQLNPEEHVLVVKSIAAFTARYGPGFRIAGEFVGSLDNDGENLRLDDAVGEKILDFDYENDWYPITDGPGASLVIVNEDAAWNTWGLKTSWRPSALDFGSPATNDPAPAASVPVLVNEVLTHTDLPLVDAIELYNPNAVAADISGWFVSDDFNEPKKYRVPANTIIPAGGYRMFTEAQFNSMPGVPPSFAFSSTGDGAFIFSGNGTNLSGGYFHGYQFGAAEQGISFGRYYTSTGGVHFVAQSVTSLQASNAAPKVGPVVISEIMYHPPDLPGGVDNDIEEYIELCNITAQPVELFDPANPGNTWRLENAVEFAFPSDITLAPSNYVLVVAFNPTNVAVLAAFRAKHNVPAGTRIFGPYSGKLDNSHDIVDLYKPDAPAGGTVPYILADRVEYADSSPWPTIADGVGPSLQRLDLQAYGDDVINWTGVLATPGQPYPGGTPPTILVQPVPATVVASQSASFSVSATGSMPLGYQWRREGVNIPGATAQNLVLVNVSSNQLGNYSVVIFNGAGYVESSNAYLTVLIPASITQQPRSQAIRLGESVTFSVSAFSNTPLRYEWRFNGMKIQNATNSAYTIAGVQVSDAGDYDVVITDAVGPIASQTATLTVLVNPTVLHPTVPLLVEVVAGSDVTFSVVATGTLPMSYRWRRGGSTLTNDYPAFRTTSFYTLRNVQPGNTNITVVITNAANAGSSSALTQVAYLLVVADTDGDRIPDQWESDNGFNPNDPADANADTDGDSLTNHEEYLAGTDPRDADSYLKVDRIAGGHSAILWFTAVSNRTYTIEFTDDLSAAQWLKHADVVAQPATHTEQVVDENSAPQRYYRLLTPRRP